jgi:hypothetical protein
LFVFSWILDRKSAKNIQYLWIFFFFERYKGFFYIGRWPNFNHYSRGDKSFVQFGMAFQDWSGRFSYLGRKVLKRSGSSAGTTEIYQYIEKSTDLQYPPKKSRNFFFEMRKFMREKTQNPFFDRYRYRYGEWGEGVANLAPLPATALYCTIFQLLVLSNTTDSSVSDPHRFYADSDPAFFSERRSGFTFENR